MDILKKLFVFTPSAKPEKFELSDECKPDFDVRDEKEIKKTYVSGDIEENLAYIRKNYSVPLNNDVVIREIITRNNKRAFVVFFEGMVSSQFVDEYIIKAISFGIQYIQRIAISTPTNSLSKMPLNTLSIVW